MSESEREIARDSLTLSVPLCSAVDSERSLGYLQLVICWSLVGQETRDHVGEIADRSRATDIAAAVLLPRRGWGRGLLRYAPSIKAYECAGSQ